MGWRTARDHQEGSTQAENRAGRSIVGSIRFLPQPFKDANSAGAVHLSTGGLAGAAHLRAPPGPFDCHPKFGFAFILCAGDIAILGFDWHRGNTDATNFGYCRLWFRRHTDTGGVPMTKLLDGGSDSDRFGF